MTTTSKKVLLVEENGVDLHDATEVNFDASEMTFSGVGWDADNVKDGILEAKSLAIDVPRFTVPLIMNSNMSNGDWITYSNLTPDSSVIIPFESYLKEVTWSNSRSGVSFDFEYYHNGRDTTKILTQEVRNSSDASGVFANINQLLHQGDVLDIKYVDQGLNCSDLVMLLMFRAAG